MFAICQAMFGLPSWLKWLGTCLQCLRPRFNPWVGKIPWRREWQSTPAFLPGESHGQRSLVGYSPWSHKDSDTPEWLTHTHMHRGLFYFHFYCTSGGAMVKNPPASAGDERDVGSIPGLGRSPGEENGNPLQ